MGACVYCGQDAGLLRKRHAECHRRAESGRAQVKEAAAAAARGSFDRIAFLGQLDTIKKSALLEKTDINPYLIAGWEQAVSTCLSDDILTREEEDNLVTFASEMGLTQADLDRSGAYTNVAKAAVLREVLEGKVPQRMQVEGSLPFNLQKGETLVWVFRDVEYYEQRTRTQYRGGSQGVSVRVARGVYYRVGAYKGEPVRTAETVLVGTGLLGVTNKHVYFASPEKALRIKYDKVVSFTPHSDGIGMQRDAQTAKPQSFLTGDGWFTYNLITNLANL